MNHPKLKFNSRYHTYYFNGKRIPNVSSIVRDAFPKFDADKVISNMRANEEKFESGPYAEMTDEEIKKLWQNKANSAATSGTKLHSQIEAYFKFGATYDNPEFRQFLKFTEDSNINKDRVKCEVRITNGQIAGTVDCVIINDDDTISLVDWKRSIKANNRDGFGKTCLVDPTIPDAHYYKYSLQLNLYKRILEDSGYNVRDMRIVQLHPEQVKYLELEVSDMSEVVSLLTN